MKSLVIGVSIGLALACAAGPASGQATPSRMESLVGAAKAAAGTDWSGTFLRLCVAPVAQAGGGGGGGGGGGAGGAAPGARRTPAREGWYAEPARVADNLYWLGTKAHHSWALVGSEGIILFEALFDYAARDEILDGLRKVGLDPADVKYVLISHGHGDHDGGAKMLQDSIPGVRLVYGAEDWDLVASQANQAGGVPRRDMVGTDGLVVSVGDASARVVTMPGHTAGTLSFIFEARDNGRPLRVAYVGGTALSFTGQPSYYDQYIASSAKLGRAAAEFGATTLLSNHTEFDMGYFKAHAAANRSGAQANPFEVGTEGVARYFSVVQNCAEAAKLRAAGR